MLTVAPAGLPGCSVAAVLAVLAESALMAVLAVLAVCCSVAAVLVVWAALWVAVPPLVSVAPAAMVLFSSAMVVLVVRAASAAGLGVAAVMQVC